MNIEIADFRNLVNDYRNFITDILISEEELYSNYYEKLTKRQLEQFGNEEINNEIESMILKEILYDFIFNIDNIKFEIEFAYGDNASDYTKQKIKEIYTKIKRVFNNMHETIFLIETIENDIIRG